MHMQQTVTSAKAQDVPQTREQLQALYEQRGELRSQLKSITSRRNELLEQQHGTQNSQALRDFQQRISAIDQRASEIDRQLISLDRAIANGAAIPVTSSPLVDVVAKVEAAKLASQSSTQALIDQAVRDATRNAARQFVGMSAMAVVAGFVLWRGFQRFFGRPSSAQIPADARRIEQLQQSIDVIALEVERMSESQRYVAKILNEKLPALGIGSDAAAMKKG